MYISGMKKTKENQNMLYATETQKMYKKKLYPPLILYAVASVFLILFDKVYALFAHGVASPYMTWMFLFPLLGGVAPIAILIIFSSSITQKKGWRAGFSLYSSGLATLTVGSLLEGILAIAGTASAYIIWFFIAGILMVLAGIGILFFQRGRQKN